MPKPNKVTSCIFRISYCICWKRVGMSGRAESIYRVMRADRGSGKGQQMEEAKRQRDQGKRGNKEGGDCAESGTEPLKRTENGKPRRGTAQQSTVEM
mgnify:CR=1 FL=1